MMNILVKAVQLYGIGQPERKKNRLLRWISSDLQTFELPIEKMTSGLLKPKAITEFFKRRKTGYEKF